MFGVALAGLAALLVLKLDALRNFEASLLALWAGPFVPGGISSWGAYYVVGSGRSDAQAFQVTVECSAAVILTPLFVIATGMILFRKVSPPRLAVAVLAMSATVLGVNQIRLAVIAWFSQSWGMAVGYEVSHRFVGSIIGVAGFVAGIALLFLIAGGFGRRNQRRRHQTVAQAQNGRID